MQLYLDIGFIVVFSLLLFWLYGLLKALPSDAPYVPMEQRVAQRLVSLAHPPSAGLWIDLGSGDGRVLIEACRQFDVRGIGIERIASLRWYSRLRILRAGMIGRISIRSGDFFKINLSDADVVSFYLLPKTTERLLPKLHQELKHGAQLLYHRYAVPGIRIDHEDAEYKIYRATAPL